MESVIGTYAVNSDRRVSWELKKWDTDTYSMLRKSGGMLSGL